MSQKKTKTKFSQGAYSNTVQIWSTLHEQKHSSPWEFLYIPTDKYSEGCTHIHMQSVQYKVGVITDKLTLSVVVYTLILTTKIIVIVSNTVPVSLLAQTGYEVSPAVSTTVQ